MCLDLKLLDYLFEYLTEHLLKFGYIFKSRGLYSLFLTNVKESEKMIMIIYRNDEFEVHTFYKLSKGSEYEIDSLYDFLGNVDVELESKVRLILL